MIPDDLQSWLDQGVRRIGQIQLLPPEEFGPPEWKLCHHEDAISARAGGQDLEHFHGQETARLIALYDDHGNYRPLRSSPDLRRGWLLIVGDIDALRQALDHFYPAAIGLWKSHLAGTLESVSLRSKLQRQTGMYRSANRISDTRAQSLIRRVCHPSGGCLKKILWPIAEGVPVASLPDTKFLDRGQAPAADEIPLLCQEACNIIVAEARLEARNEVIVVKE